VKKWLFWLWLNCRQARQGAKNAKDFFYLGLRSDIIGLGVLGPLAGLAVFQPTQGQPLIFHGLYLKNPFFINEFLCYTP